jgi:hypothetical protein
VVANNIAVFILSSVWSMGGETKMKLEEQVKKLEMQVINQAKLIDQLQRDKAKLIQMIENPDRNYD